MQLAEIRILTAAFRSFSTPKPEQFPAIERLIASMPNVHPVLLEMIQSAGRSTAHQAANSTWHKCIEHVAEQLSEAGTGVDKELFIRACTPLPIIDPAPGYTVRDCIDTPEFGYPYR